MYIEETVILSLNVPLNWCLNDIFHSSIFSTEISFKSHCLFSPFSRYIDGKKHIVKYVRVCCDVCLFCIIIRISIYLKIYIIISKYEQQHNENLYVLIEEKHFQYYEEIYR